MDDVPCWSNLLELIIIIYFAVNILVSYLYVLLLFQAKMPDIPDKIQRVWETIALRQKSRTMPKNFED